MRQAKRLELAESVETHVAEDGKGRRALDSKCRDVSGFLDDRYVETDRVRQQPVIVTFLRTEPVFALAQMKDRAVVEHPGPDRRTRPHRRPFQA